MLSDHTKRLIAQRYRESSQGNDGVQFVKPAMMGYNKTLHLIRAVAGDPSHPHSRTKIGTRQECPDPAGHLEWPAKMHHTPSDGPGPCCEYHERHLSCQGLSAFEIKSIYG